MKTLRCRRIRTIAAVLVTTLAGFAAPATSADAVRLKTDFSPVGYQSIFYAAVGRGTYRQHGLEVEIIPGNGSYAGVMDIAGDKVDFAFADTGALVVAALNANVRNVRIVSMIFEVTPYTILYLKNKGISKPQDLKGKTMADFQGSGTGRIVRVFARVNGFDMASITTVMNSPSTYLNPVVIGQADFAATTVNRLPNLIGPARQAGNELAEFRFPDYGVDIFGAALIANTRTIEQRKDVVKRFVQASLESARWSAENPDQAVDYLVKSNPQIQKAQALVDLKTTVDTSIPRGKTAKNALSLGWVDADKMKRTVEMVREGYELKQTIDPALLYTNEHVARP